jgi:alpha-beta hydrolase superfamily lysophospholipase
MRPTRLLSATLALVLGACTATPGPGTGQVPGPSAGQVVGAGAPGPGTGQVPGTGAGQVPARSAGQVGAKAGQEAARVSEAAPALGPCPPGPPADAKCYRGRDSAGTHYLIAVPAKWNQVLVVHAHGGPQLEAKIERADEDAKRWAVIPKAGYAYAASVFRGGVAVRSAAEDTERVRQIFVQHISQPRRTILHGQSWGANVAAKLAETHAAPGAKPTYDGVLLTSGVLAGGAASYAFRLDLRVIYQYLCNNHPRPTEKQYPLWMGLPADSKLTRQELDARVTECLGKAQSRTPEQARKVKTIVDVLQIKESSIASHLNWATWHFQDIAMKRTEGKNPFGNVGVVYKGSDDDAALNKGVLRYAADPEAVRMLAEDTDPTGRIGVPVLTVHGIGDPTAFVELEAWFRRAMEQAGTAQNLVQIFSEIPEHSYLSDPIYPAALAGLVHWVDTGQKPSPIAFAAGCTALEGMYGASCHIYPGYKPAPLASRVAPRPGI